MTLGKIMENWPEEYPQTLTELVEADSASLSDHRAKELRSQALDLVRSWEKHHISGPWDALQLLSSGYVLHTWENAWRSYALGSDRAAMMIPKEGGASRYLVKATKLLPQADELPALPSGKGEARKPEWLVIYGGTPEVLSKPGVPQRLAKLLKSAPISDVVFYAKDPTPTLWSLRAGVGVKGASKANAATVAFPDAAALAEIRSLM